MSWENPEENENGLWPAEQALVDALKAGEPCVFVREGDDAQPENQRKIRGKILGQILREETVGEYKNPIALPRSVLIFGASIKGILDMSDTHSNRALRIEHCDFEKASDFSRARLNLLSLEGSKLSGIDLKFIELYSHLWLDDIENQGELDLAGARIGGQLSIVSITHQVKLVNISGDAVNAQGAHIGSGVYLRGAKVLGCAYFSGAKIEGQFSAECVQNDEGKTVYETQFINHEDIAVSLQNARISSNISLTGATINGCLWFFGINVGGSLELDGSSLMNPGRTVLNLSHAQVSGHFFIDRLSHIAIGIISLHHATFLTMIIDETSHPLGYLDLNGTRYDSLLRANGDAYLDCEGWLNPLSSKRLNVLRSVTEKEFDKHIEKRINASNKSFESLPNHVKDKLTTLKIKTLAKFDPSKPSGYWSVFKALCEAYAKDDQEFLNKEAIRVKVRAIIDQGINIANTLETSPFAYRQFAKVLDINGHEREAKKVRIEAGNLQTKRTANKIKPFLLRWAYHTWRFIIRWTTGYGQHLQNAVYCLLILLVIGTCIFGVASDDMVPSRERFYLSESYDAFVKNGTLPSGYPDYNPFIYSVDVMLPIVDFAQESHWRPKNTDSRFNWLRNYNRLHLALGWFLSTIGIAGMTGLLSDRREP